jgi:hypothetical protein
VADLQKKEGDGHLDAWDECSRVEALLALDQLEQANRALDRYLEHPDMNAFAVSSTHRQFEEVLQLDRSPTLSPLLSRLWSAVLRHRSDGVAARKFTAGSASGFPESAQEVSVLIRLSDPERLPEGVANLRVRGHLGPIVSAEGPRGAMEDLLRDPAVISIEESRPGETGNEECHRSLPFVKVLEPYPGPTAPYSERGDRSLIAIIDNGIDVLHQAFLDGAGHSRIVGIWDQRDETGPRNALIPFGTFHDDAMIDGYVKNGIVPNGLGRNPDGHGTHVASIAAGRPAGTFAGGVACEAALLVVICNDDGPIGYSASHLAALDFIDKMATSLGRPVVVNVSKGMNAGAHDGKSLFEIGFQSFLLSGTKPGRVVVKSAGNERARNGHASFVMAPSSVEDLTWRRDPGGPRTERIELWWSSANELRFQLVDPNGSMSGWVDEAHPEESGELAPGGSKYAVKYVRRHPDNGHSSLRIELGGPITSGGWVLHCDSRAVPDEGTVHAWLERSNSAQNTVFTNNVSINMTLSIPGTAADVITVGAVEACQPIQTGTFSSYGPTRDGRKKPDIAAPGVGITAARGGTSNGVLTDDGTSMAAPHVAGAVALVLSRAVKENRPIPNACQIAEAIRQKAAYGNWTWNPGRGFGVLDVAALLSAF